MQNLPPTAARLLPLCDVGYKYDEIATELGIPVGTVKTRLFTAREMLRRRLEM